MPADIRSFFGSQNSNGSTTKAPAKAPPKKQEVRHSIFLTVPSVYQITKEKWEYKELKYSYFLVLSFHFRSRYSQWIIRMKMEKMSSKFQFTNLHAIL
jgi:hypothetical protein